MKNPSRLFFNPESLSRGVSTGNASTRLITAIAATVVLSFAVSACSNSAKELPVIYSFQGLHTTFINEDSAKVDFPQRYTGSVFVMSFIYAHCPNVCPLTTQNLHTLQDSLADLGIKGGGIFHFSTHALLELKNYGATGQYKSHRPRIRFNRVNRI